MKPTKILKLALLGAAVIPAAAMADSEKTLELRAGVRGADDKTIAARTVAKAPENASYQTALVGFVYYADSWNNLPDNEYTPMGIYTIGAKPGSQPEPFAQIGKASSHCSGGAVLAGDTYWYIWRQTDPTGASGFDMSQLYSYNVVTGEARNYGVVSSELASSSDKAWDPVSRKIYGQYSIDGARKLCVVDYEEQTVTPVGDCAVYYGLAFDAAGQLYGIDGGGLLCKVDKTNGKSTVVGSTGITPQYVQSMTIDPKTGDLWWASYADAGKNSSVLYKVDTQTAKATPVTVFADQQEILGLGVMPALAPDGAPGYATSLTVSTDKASADATVSFSTPGYTYMGDELKGNVKWRVLANGNEVKSGEAAPAASVSETMTLPLGSVVVSVICSNAEGDGPAAAVTRWIGEGYPVAPTGVRFTIDEKSGKASLSWDAVTEGMDGGYVDPAKITYKVIAYPGKREAAKGLAGTSFTETLEMPYTPVDTYYEVIACNDWRESDPAQSNHTPYGRGFEVPYDNSFDSPEDLTLFYITDGNNDGRTWGWSQYNGKTAYIFTGTDAEGDQDDWLITPGIDMKAGNRYQITYFTNGNAGGGQPGRFIDMLELCFGKGVDPSAYKVVQEKFVYDCTGERRYDVIVAPEEDGYYHFGFHAISNCVKGLAMNIDNIHIDVLANDDAPAKVTDLSVKTSQGVAPVTVSFTTPVKTVGGEKLGSLTKVELWRNHSELVKSQEVTKPGVRAQLVDSKGGKGATVYTVVAYNEHGVGERAEIEVYLGLDVPSAPTGIVLADNGKGGLKLSWEAPVKGANGGYVDPANIRYNVYTVTNGYAVEYETGVAATELSIDQHPDYYAASQELVVYGVAAVNNIGESGIRQSSEVILGQPYTYPFAESWNRGVPTHEMWYRANSGESGWLPSDIMTSDNDGGSIGFEPAQAGDMSYIYLGKVDMSAARQPKLIFDYFGYPGADAFIQPEVNKAFRDGWHQATPVYFTQSFVKEGWNQYVLDLKDFMQYPYITVRFLGKTDKAHPLYIDNVRIMDSELSGVDGIQTDAPAAGTYYDLNGFKVANPRKGSLYILRRADGSAAKVLF